MLPELSQLIDLHELDKEILEVDQQLNQLPQELETRAQELQTLEGEQASKRQELEDLHQQRREAETDVTDLEEGIKDSRKRLLTTKKDIEYKAMLKEIAFKEDQRDQKMQTFDQHLFDLYEAGQISYEDALRNADSVNELRLMIKLHGKEAKDKDLSTGIEHLNIV